jgi:hypothetical protein
MTGYQTLFRTKIFNPRCFSATEENPLNTINMLIAHFGGSPIIPVENAAEYLRYKPDTLKQKILRGDIRLAAFSIESDSQKAQKFVKLADLAELIDEHYQVAKQDFDVLWDERGQ